MPSRWIGIDEAGYGPNLGPLVLTAVVAEGPGSPDDRPDPWRDLPATVGRCGSPAPLLWLDDSKRLTRTSRGLARLEAAATAALAAAGHPPPSTLDTLFTLLGIPPADAELSPWLPDPSAVPLPDPAGASLVSSALALRPFTGAPWRLTALRSVVVGPRRFNRDLAASRNKSSVHFSAFARLLRWCVSLSSDGVPTDLLSDKHGGRHYYADPLRSSFPDLTVTPSHEGPSLSRYALRSPSHSLTLSLTPRADVTDALASLASVVSKLIREHWMAAFNAYWRLLLPDLPPTAGYPVDALRFRRAIEAQLSEPNPPVEIWWRLK